VAPLNAEDEQHLAELAHDDRHLCCPSRLIYFRAQAMIWSVFPMPSFSVHRVC